MHAIPVPMPKAQNPKNAIGNTAGNVPVKRADLAPPTYDATPPVQLDRNILLCDSSIANSRVCRRDAHTKSSSHRRMSFSSGSGRIIQASRMVKSEQFHQIESYLPHAVRRGL
ncbi:uncharacterized protein AKAW2_40486S [Aspergillus luchuensis]|uniref:Uncharacterized protein n=1 Tax=Aspergillus kawachii TaxID=1069201 RepID=A0A7R7W9I2_ASPKA|nr:uncharacterized protein AKAW2_40486S [Aspergillus luchuensis]BCR98803.1 hypothetical protein AKAW2_40486S [Aspergillus luchuensis]